MKWNIENILINIQATLKEMKETFAAGVNTIYDAIVARDVTPASKSPADMAAAIAEISGTELIPVIVNGVLQSGFEFTKGSNTVITEKDGFIEVETKVGFAAINTIVNAAFADCEAVNAQYTALKFMQQPGYNTVINTSSSDAINTTRNLVSIGSTGNNQTNIVFSGGANGDIKIYNLYIYKIPETEE